jgi:hypothetical protein
MLPPSSRPVSPSLALWPRPMGGILCMRFVFVPEELMDATLLKAIAASVPIGLLLIGSIVTFTRHRSVPAILQVAGGACLTIVVLAHGCEAFRLFPWMRWGEERSMGHYLDIALRGITWK